MRRAFVPCVLELFPVMQLDWTAEGVQPAVGTQQAGTQQAALLGRFVQPHCTNVVVPTAELVAELGSLLHEHWKALQTALQQSPVMLPPAPRTLESVIGIDW